MSKNDCLVCLSDTRPAFEAIVLNKYLVKYCKCVNCGFLFAKNPNWLGEAYNNSAIAQNDDGLLIRNIKNWMYISVLANYFTIKSQSNYLDYSGGYGVFVKLMRYLNFNFYWQDLYCKNIFAKKFEYSKEKNYDLITLFEVIEHVEDPQTFFRDIVNKFNPKIIIFTTLLHSKNNIPNINWWYYDFDSGQHISFYTKQSIIYIAKNFNFHYYNINNFHILSRKKLNKLIFNLVTLKIVIITIFLFIFLKNRYLNIK